MTKIKFKEGNNWIDIGLEYYPIGAIYQSTDSTSPSTLFGGTWTEITDKFLLAAGTTYAAASTGGAATVTLDSTMIPSHTHSVGAHSHGLNSHKHSVGAHAHGLNSHKHTYDKASSPSGSTTLTTDQIPSHSHKPHTWAVVLSSGGGSGRMEADWWSGGANLNTFNADGDQNRWSGSTGGGKGHTHTISTTSTASGAASGNTANSTAFDSGAASGSTANSTAFNSGATGGSKAHNNMPPYLAVYTWKRVA